MATDEADSDNKFPPGDYGEEDKEKRLSVKENGKECNTRYSVEKEEQGLGLVGGRSLLCSR